MEGPGQLRDSRDGRAAGAIGPRSFACLLATLTALLALASPSFGYGVKRACSQPRRGRAACLAMRLEVEPAASSSAEAGRVASAPRKKPYPGFLTPERLHAAYDTPVQTSADATQTIAVVDAFDDPTAEADLAVYDEQFGLPACTAANGCFEKVNEHGEASPLPAVEGGWASEISIDVQMAHATCQGCKVLLVETNSEEFGDLATGVEAAASLGATEISNSYGGTEESSVEPLAADYDHPGIVIAASTGDCGYENTSSECPRATHGANFPADSPDVVAVGGTSLSESAGTWASSAWDDGGSGCSTIFQAPPWQSAAAGYAASGCGTGRVLADVAAIGNPNTGVDVYDSTPEEPGAQTGWGVWGGTSVASPIVAAEFALAGGADGVAYPAQTLYSHAAEAADLYDVTSGSNGSCSTRTICKAVAGFDGPTGIGSPVGLGAFTPTGTPESTSAPGISGTPEEGETLTEEHGGWTNDPTGYSYQWERCGSSGANCQPVTGAEGPTFVVPEGFAGYTVRVLETAHNEQGSGSAHSDVVGPVAGGQPHVTGVTPAQGITGSTIVVEGEALDSATAVSLGSLAASFTVVSPAELKVTVPDGTLKGRVTVVTPRGTASSRQLFRATLSITGFSPRSRDPGKAVTIKGIGFNSSSQVTFDGVQATIESFTAKKIKAIVPADAGTGPIAVTNTLAPAGTVVSAASFGS